MSIRRPAAPNIIGVDTLHANYNICHLYASLHFVLISTMHVKFTLSNWLKVPTQFNLFGLHKLFLTF